MPPSPGPVIDLRSDTVTQPSAGMREAMAQAAVGDDQYGEDPTTNLLHRLLPTLREIERYDTWQSYSARIGSSTRATS